MKKINIIILALLFLSSSPTIAQTIIFNTFGDCSSPMSPPPPWPISMFLDGTSDDRNVYRSNPGDIYSYTVIHVGGTGGAWQIKFQGAILFEKISGSSPNPPFGTSGWLAFIYPFCTITEFSGSGVLPIEILNFNVKNEYGKNILIWKTATEFNNKNFDIERSTDGKIFTSLGQVKAENKPHSYQFVDNYPFNTTYYRLKQIDFDATETYSKVVVSIAKERTKGLQIYPTLVSNGELNIIYVEDKQSEEFVILNFLGQQVLSGKTANQINISGLAKGTYILKIGTEVEKFIKL